MNLSNFLSGAVTAPITANEGGATVWIFAGIVGILAVAGIVFFIINSKKK